MAKLDLAETSGPTRTQMDLLCRILSAISYTRHYYGIPYISCNSYTGSGSLDADAAGFHLSRAL